MLVAQVSLQHKNQTITTRLRANDDRGARLAEGMEICVDNAPKVWTVVYVGPAERVADDHHARTWSLA